MEPENGRDLDRYITSLLNATGVVHRMIDTTPYGPAAGGKEVMGAIAERLRAMLSLLAERHGDEELALVTQVLASTTVLVAAELDLGHCFRAG